MKQILQSLKTGDMELAEVPCPAVARGQLLVRTVRTLVSTGTERMLVDFGKASWIEKARQQPDKVRMVIDKVKTDGLMPTLETVRNKLDQPLALGYCNVGIVEAIGAGVTQFEVGDRVASNGKHAEMVSVPANLCARVPKDVSDDEAAFTVIGAIALQGIRLAQPTLGETVVVTGLGLIGLMTVQLLKAHGCRVVGLDFDPSKLDMARKFGAEVVNLAAGEDPLVAAHTFSRGRGVDAVIITASTKSNDPVHQAAVMCRKRGRIVLVGVTGLELSRADFYEKELRFQVSCSYGPGRYDPDYEDRGNDYPVGFVRWTAQRNFEAVLDMLAGGRIEVSTLVTHRFAIGLAHEAYKVVSGSEPSMGILLEYPADDPPRLRSRTIAVASVSAATSQTPVVSFIGAGNYATAVLIPAFKATGAELRTVASNAGITGTHAGRKFGFAQSTTDTEEVLADPCTDAVVITTRHDSHADLVLKALAAGKHVYVEKPLCLTLEELDLIDRTTRSSRSLIMVGFNRRFAPQIVKIKSLMSPMRAPKSLVMTVNAGAIPASHWTQDNQVGGGRVIGEACHFVDLLRHLVGHPIARWKRSDMATATRDTVSLSLEFEDGSIGTIHYFANGSKAFPKERLEVFAAGGVLQLDNFRQLRGYGWPGFRSMNLWRQDKGQHRCAASFIEAIASGGRSPIPLEEILEVSRVTIEASEEH